MKTLYQKLDLLLKELKSIEGLDLKQERSVFSEKEVNTLINL